MTQKYKYYIITETGEKKLVRTSTHDDYKYYMEVCTTNVNGKCSKSLETMQNEYSKCVDMYYKNIQYCKDNYQGEELEQELQRNENLFKRCEIKELIRG